MRQREMKEVKTNQQAPKNHKESHQLLQFVFYNNCLSQLIKSKTQHPKRNDFKSQHSKIVKELMQLEQQEVSSSSNELIFNFTRLIILLSYDDWYYEVQNDQSRQFNLAVLLIPSLLVCVHTYLSFCLVLSVASLPHLFISKSVCSPLRHSCPLSSLVTLLSVYFVKVSDQQHKVFQMIIL